MSDAQLSVSPVLATVPSADLARSEQFYTALVGRPVDDRPMPVLAQWRWGEFVLQVVDDVERTGGGLFTLLVPDMAVAVAAIRDRGLSVNYEEGTVVAQVAVMSDPDGNQITLVEAR